MWDNGLTSSWKVLAITILRHSVWLIINMKWRFGKQGTTGNSGFHNANIRDVGEKWYSALPWCSNYSPTYLREQSWPLQRLACQKQLGGHVTGIIVTPG